MKHPLLSLLIGLAFVRATFPLQAQDVYGSFAGNGNKINSLNADNLGAGTMPWSRFPSLLLNLNSLTFADWTNRIVAGSNVTLATNTPGVVTISAEITGGTVSGSDVTNIVNGLAVRLDDGYATNLTVMDHPGGGTTPLTIRILDMGTQSSNLIEVIDDQSGNRVFALDGTGVLQGNAGGLTNLSLPSTITNSIFIPAGAMGPIGAATTSEGGRTSASAGGITNSTSRLDCWNFDDTTNECVSFQWAPGPAFLGNLSFTLHWLTPTPHVATNGVWWEVAVAPVATNNSFGAYIYATNVLSAWGTGSNILFTAALPLIVVTNLTPDALIDVRLSRLGTNTANKLIGDAQLIGARIGYNATRWTGNY